MNRIYITILVIVLAFTANAQDPNLKWARQMGGSSTDIGHSITIDGGGNVYTTGYFRETVDFDPGTGVQNLTSTGWDDIFIQKLDANGDFLWAKPPMTVVIYIQRGISMKQ